MPHRQHAAVLPAIDAFSLAAAFLALETYLCLTSHKEPVDFARVWYCASGNVRESLWVAATTLVVEATMHSLLRASAFRNLNWAIVVLLDAVVLGSIAAGCLLNVRFQHNAQNEMYVFETGRVDWVYAATMFLIPAVLVAAIVFFVEIVVHRVARCMGR